jgi:hypothetical protein
MRLRSLGHDDDRGAILVHVAFALLAMMGFVAMTLDYGVMWASRGQAQNAADAGALAGAVALAFDNPSDFTDGGPAKQNAFEATQLNVVWGSPPDVDVTTDITFPTCPPDSGGGACIKVDVYRTQARGNPLPMFFGQLFGRTAQDMRATAMAHVGGANSARCALPFMLSDRWEDNFDDFVDTGTYPNDGDHLTGDPIAGWSNNDHYQEPQGDAYRAPYPGEPNPTGWTTSGDFGRQLILHDPVGMYSAGWAGIAQLPGLGPGGDDFRDALWDCEFNNNVVAIADENWDCTEHGYPNDTTVQMGLEGCLSVKTGWVAGPSEQGVEGGGPVAEGLLEQDDDAVWSWSVAFGPNGEAGGVVKSATDDSPNMTSPRVRPLPVIDNTAYIASGCSGTGCLAKVVNLIGFFVEGMCDEVRAAGRLDPGNDCDPDSNERYQLVGRIVTLPGNLVGTGMPVTESSFLKTVRLIR